MTIETLDARLNTIVAPDARVESLSEDFEFTEGPVWHPHAQHLRFSDISGNRLYQWDAETGISIYREPSQMANGNTYDRQGRLLSCEHATSSVVREEDGQLKVLASHYQERELNSPNDIVVASDGWIYFTDPTYGRHARHGVERPQQLDFQGVYRLHPEDLTLQLLADDFEQPNGLCLSLDERELFVADTTRRHVRRFALGADGRLSGGSVFAESPAPDGLKLDSRGNLYAGGPGGVHVYEADTGAQLGRIGTPAFCANFTWGGADLKTLFMTASTGLYRVPVAVAGLPLFA